ncbi:hypothetical protein AB1A81_08290 [Bdellovibrio bacteriovorus]|uniref:Outer membrane protein beta-barrel domain-containing protein n=1 Tax=Bdellovibrio bacteriovorus (strain ATCC 15356 / DSM 50701 / NCIMB 9529 / HD100) TaxID=264462 RepID=Q6MM32_BDEBA|nr:hypothetical protein [Bdellovibrio bacteriovorus]CAE79674.1 hypothetical protein predicted by Glimmer/Critica [Bdellovibrio bacteriovorus HD100]
MSKKILALAVFMAGSVLSLQSQAATSNGVLVNANIFMYNNSTETTPGGESKSNSSIYDIKLGYISGNGLYLGGLYTLRKVETDSGSVDGNALGASIGYVGASGFYVKGHYLLSAEYDTLKEGTGIQADFGYMTNVTSSFFVGVELTYRSIEYKKNEASPGMDSLKISETFPMLTVGFIF